MQCLKEELIMNNTGAPFPETADIETASEGYAARFAGGIGQWMLGLQERIVRQALRDCRSGRILDVGGGHGQLAIPLAEAGYAVTVAGSSEAPPPRLQQYIQDGRISYQQANLIDLPYAAASFDTVICFRFISHCGRWRQLVDELCRVGGKRVVIDYPNWESVNIASPALFKLKRLVEKNTRHYTIFSHRQISRAFQHNGFSGLRRHNQFFLPMALHRAMKKPALSSKLENLCRTCGLTAALGSPTILVAEKGAGS
jgi:2-polyprenyl-3-methyl-5-hydroxy-6-metoxy-1,4-benzoquinol methylase